MIKLFAYYDTTEESRYSIADGIYAHGELEYKLGHDILCPRINVLSDHKFELIDIKEEGIHDVIVQLNELQIPAKLYYWKSSDRNRGLVVLPEDTEAIKDAETHFKEKSCHL